MTQITQDKIIADSCPASRKLWSWSIILIGAFIFCFIKAIMALIIAWRNSDIYSYGFLIPFISLYILWVQREKLKLIQPSPCYLSGFPVLLAGIAFFIISNTQTGTSIKGFSLILTIMGIILTLTGRRFLMALWFPISYLLFMVPFWDNFTERLHVPFQNFSAMTGTKLLQLIGIPVFRESIYIELPNITLEVAKVCSGVNNLIAIVAIAVPLAYLTIHGWTRRIMLVIGSTLIAILGNGLRVAMIGGLSYYGISKVLHGPYHVLQAMSISIFGFIALFIGAWLLSRGDAPAVASKPTEKTIIPSRDHSGNFCVEVRYPFLLAIIVLLAVGSYINFYR